MIVVPPPAVVPPLPVVPPLLVIPPTLVVPPLAVVPALLDVPPEVVAPPRLAVFWGPEPLAQPAPIVNNAARRERRYRWQVFRYIGEQLLMTPA
jgi:hypothetical protein